MWLTFASLVIVECPYKRSSFGVLGSSSSLNLQITVTLVSNKGILFFGNSF